MTEDWRNKKISELTDNKKEEQDVVINKNELLQQEAEELSSALLVLEKNKITVNNKLIEIIQNNVLSNLENEIKFYNDNQEELPFGLYNKMQTLSNILGFNKKGR